MARFLGRVSLSPPVKELTEWACAPSCEVEELIEKVCAELGKLSDVVTRKALKTLFTIILYPWVCAPAELVVALNAFLGRPVANASLEPRARSTPEILPALSPLKN